MCIRDRLQVNGEKQGVEVFAMGDKQSPVDIAKAAYEHAKKEKYNVVILDTAGRLHIDEGMMQELANIKEAISVDQTVLVVDAMTGQDAVNVCLLYTSIDDDFYEEIEEILVMGDLGINATNNIIEDLKRQVAEKKIKDPQECICCCKHNFLSLVF